MDLCDRKSAMRVAASFAGKTAVELALMIGELAARLGDAPQYMIEIDERAAARHIATIRRELEDLEALIAGREPPVAAAPRAA